MPPPDSSPASPSAPSARHSSSRRSGLRRIAFQGELGAHSHLALSALAPDAEPLPCATFAATLRAVREGAAAQALIPVENTIAGRVADIHRLLPESGLFIVGEHFLPIRHALMGVPGARLTTLRRLYSHEMALRQCWALLEELGLEAHVTADTAGAARRVAAAGDAANAALATPLAAKIHGLRILRRNVQDVQGNTTRFLLMAAAPDDAEPEARFVITSLLFRVRNTPAALYKALAGFATNNVNLVKLESYQLDASFTSTQFYADIEGHPEHEAVRRALEELMFFCSKLTILGVYRAHTFRRRTKPSPRGEG